MFLFVVRVSSITWAGSRGKSGQAAFGGVVRIGGIRCALPCVVPVPPGRLVGSHPIGDKGVVRLRSGGVIEGINVIPDFSTLPVRSWSFGGRCADATALPESAKDSVVVSRSYSVETAQACSRASAVSNSLVEQADRRPNSG